MQLIYNDLGDDERVFPAQRRFNSETGVDQQGLNVNIYENFNTEGAAYVQDKWEYEGMVVNAGLRYEWFFDRKQQRDPDQRTRRSIRTLMSGKFKPLAASRFAFPITDRDKFFFHYGRFTQWPSRVYLFRTQDAVGSLGTLGNPNLEPELTVSYQAGISHQFTDDIAGNFVVFNKDIYGLISSTQVTDDSTGIQSLPVTSTDVREFARARDLTGEAADAAPGIRGVLHVLVRRRRGQRRGLRPLGAGSYPPCRRKSYPLDWDQRHTFNVTLRLQDRNKWGARRSTQYGSGLPWTPVDRFARLAGSDARRTRCGSSRRTS